MGRSNENRRRLADAVCLGRYPADPIWPAQPLCRIERPRPAAHPHRRRAEGHAFLGSASNSATTDGQGLITHLKPVLMGKNPLHREAIVTELWRKQRVAGVRAIGAVDVALWDLVGKIMGQPIHRLLGTFRES